MVARLAASLAAIVIARVHKGMCVSTVEVQLEDSIAALITVNVQCEWILVR